MPRVTAADLSKLEDDGWIYVDTLDVVFSDIPMLTVLMKRRIAVNPVNSGYETRKRGREGNRAR
jgi:hypothetical protein